MAKRKLRSLQQDIDRLLDALEPGFKALVVIHNPDTGEGMMTNSCCDMCGFSLSAHAMQKYLEAMTPAQQLRAMGSQFTVVQELTPEEREGIRTLDELAEVIWAEPISKVSH